MNDDPKAIRQHFAHALLSPLTVVLGSLDMLLHQDTAWPGYAKEVLELALAQAQRLHDTLNDLLATAEVEDNTVLLSWSPPVPQRTGTPAPSNGDSDIPDGPYS
jgi:signal transduction histidine kinase